MPPENEKLEETSQPSAPQEPTLEAPIPPSTSEPIAMPPQAPESPTEAESAVPVNNDNPEISHVEPENPVPTQTAQIDKVEENQLVPEAPQLSTAQIPVNEPFAPAPDRLSLLAKAREAIQFRKRRKLEKIMGMFLKQASITNDEVEKFLHVSDATATRYLEQLEKQGKIKQEGRMGKSVSYSRM